MFLYCGVPATDLIRFTSWGIKAKGGYLSSKNKKKKKNY